MDKVSIIKQGIDICDKQVKYIEFGLKQSENTPYLVTTISIINTILNTVYNDFTIKNKQDLFPLLYKIDIKI